MADLTWGDEVIVSEDAPAELRPGATAWVVGLGIEGNPSLTIEFHDGSDLQISPELLLKKSSGESS